MAISELAKPAPAATVGTKSVKEVPRKSCFVISPIGQDDTDIRKRSDQVLRHIIKKALSDTYAVERADDISKPGLITLQIIELLMKAPMVVADLSDANANVYYELAIRHFVKKPVVHLITEGQKPPFDVAQMRYISYDLTDPDSVERAAQDVRDHAAACERGEATFTPIQFVELLDSARGKEQDPFAIYALGIQSALSNLQSDLREVVSQVGYLSSVLADERAPYGIAFNQPRYTAKFALPPWALDPAAQKFFSSRKFYEAAIAAAKKELAKEPTIAHPEPTGTPIAPPVDTGGPIGTRMPPVVIPPKDEK